MINYYIILNIHQSATQEEIKCAFRKLAKKYHPDMNPSTDKEWAEEKFKIISIAFNTLYDTVKRKEYDSKLYFYTSKKNYSYWNKIKNQPDDYFAQSRLILYFLITGEAKSAINIYEKLKKNKDFQLSSYLDFEDYLDCSFLLGEEFEIEGHYNEALTLFSEVYKNEQKNPRMFGYFLEESKNRIYRLFIKYIPRKKQPEERIKFYKSALEMKLSPQQEAYAFKKICQAYLEMDEVEKARENLYTALSIYPNLKGIQKIYSKIGIPVAQLQNSI